MKLISMLHKIMPLDTLKAGKSIYNSHTIAPYTLRSYKWPCLSSFSTKLLYAFLTVGRDSSVGISTRYGMDGPRIECRWVARCTAPVQSGPGVRPASYTLGIGSFPRVKLRGWSRTPTLSSVEVKERVEL